MMGLTWAWDEYRADQEPDIFLTDERSNEWTISPSVHLLNEAVPKRSSLLTDSHSGRIILKMLVWGGCSAITQESRCKKNWGACVTVADSLWDRQVFIQRIDVGLKCLGLLRFKRSSTEGRTHGLPRTLLVTTCCYTNLPFNPTPLQFFFDKLGSPWQLDSVHWAEAKCHGDPSLSKWGPNGDPKTEKGPNGDPGPQMGTHLATVPPTT